MQTTPRARLGSESAMTLVEVPRPVPYGDLTTAAVEGALAARPGLADAKPGVDGHQIVSRKFTYDVAISACSLDDPKDRLGAHEATVTFCSDSDVADGDTPAAQSDRNPDDFRRVAVSLS